MTHKILTTLTFTHIWDKTWRSPYIVLWVFFGTELCWEQTHEILAIELAQYSDHIFSNQDIKTQAQVGQELSTLRCPYTPQNTVSSLKFS